MEAGGYFKSCRFITIMHKCLKVSAKNSPALLFLSRGKEEERKNNNQLLFPCCGRAEQGNSWRKLSNAPA